MSGRLGTGTELGRGYRGRSRVKNTPSEYMVNHWEGRGPHEPKACPLPKPAIFPLSNLCGSIHPLCNQGEIQASIEQERARVCSGQYTGVRRQFGKPGAHRNSPGTPETCPRWNLAEDMQLLLPRFPSLSFCSLLPMLIAWHHVEEVPFPSACRPYHLVLAYFKSEGKSQTLCPSLPTVVNFQHP